MPRLAVAVLATSLLTVPLFAAPTPQPVAPAATWFTIGDVRVASLHDADLLVPNDGKVFGVDAGVPAVAGVLAAAGLPGGAIPVSINSLLVRLPGRTVLIDTGLPPASGSVLIASLAAAGVTPAQVTDVLLTHSHGDHVGGLLAADGLLAFPNAKVRMSAAEWTFLQANTGAAKLVAAITPQVATFAPGAEVVPGIRARAVAGHTPGHVWYDLTSGGAHLLDIADTAHSTIVSLTKPDWIMGFDSDPAVGRASRRAELIRLAASHDIVFAPHFIYPGVGRIAAQGDGFVWIPMAATAAK